MSYTLLLGPSSTLCNVERLARLNSIPSAFGSQSRLGTFRPETECPLNHAFLRPPIKSQGLSRGLIASRFCIYDDVFCFICWSLTKKGRRAASCFASPPTRGSHPTTNPSRDSVMIQRSYDMPSNKVNIRTRDYFWLFLLNHAWKLAQILAAMSPFNDEGGAELRRIILRPLIHP
jgi:hypothetical protein